MKKIFILLFAGFFLIFSAFADDSAGSLNFQGVPLRDALVVYQKMSGLELDIDVRVKRLNSSITVRTEKSLTKKEVLKLLETTFAKQAQIVITQTDDKHASVKLKQTPPSVH